MSEPSRPLPAPDDASAPYFEAAASHELRMPRCSRCEVLSFPPDLTCQNCGTTDPDFTWVRVSGRGTVRSWTTLHQSFLPGFADDLPFVLVDVELAEQPDLRMIARLLDGPDEPLTIGTPVLLAFEDLTPDVAIPAFRVEVAS